MLGMYVPIKIGGKDVKDEFLGRAKEMTINWSVFHCIVCGRPLDASLREHRVSTKVARPGHLARGRSTAADCGRWFAGGGGR